MFVSINFFYFVVEILYIKPGKNDHYTKKMIKIVQATLMVMEMMMQYAKIISRERGQIDI